MTEKNPPRSAKENVETVEVVQKNSEIEYFKNDFQKLTYVRTYARWMDDKGRRESWPETVARLLKFFKDERGHLIPSKVMRKIEKYILELSVMPSMRMLWAAGDAARKDNTTIYNCSFVKIESLECFSEMLHILMCGTGVGFSVLPENIDKLPIVPSFSGAGAGVHLVDDSREGWASSLRLQLQALYSGRILDFDYSLLRPKGARLQTMGGRSSGPEPLMRLHKYVDELFVTAQGRKLTTIEVHDLCCQIAEVVVVGGVRRSSLISLSALNDESMRHAKDWPMPVRRHMANNSAVYDEKPDAITFLSEWAALAKSGTGERGIYNRGSARKLAPDRRDGDKIEGTNPCGEISLRSRQFCNLSEVVVRAEDTFDDLLEKVEAATWIGAIQSTFTKFPHLRPEWQKNCEEERLLGVSITGQYDAPHLMSEEKLKILRERAIKVAKRASILLGINMPTAVTCVKPSGTVSQLVDSASGMHPRYAPFYIRRYRISSTDPLFRLLKDDGVPVNPENGQRRKDWNKAEKAYLETQSFTDATRICPLFEPGQEWSKEKVTTWVVSCPVAAPKGAITVAKVNAIDQLNFYKKVQSAWCEHNASVTIYVAPNEWMDVGKWVYENWESVVGVSFLPADTGHYEQAPYEEISKDEYALLMTKTKAIDFSKLSSYETEDETSGAKSYACTSGVCELV